MKKPIVGKQYTVTQNAVMAAGYQIKFFQMKNNSKPNADTGYTPIPLPKGTILEYLGEQELDFVQSWVDNKPLNIQKIRYHRFCQPNLPDKPEHWLDDGLLASFSAI